MMDVPMIAGGEMGNDEHACFDIGWYLDVGIDGKSCTGCWYVWNEAVRHFARDLFQATEAVTASSTFFTWYSKIALAW